MPVRAARVEQFGIQPAEARARCEPDGCVVVRLDLAVKQVAAPRVVRVFEPQTVRVGGTCRARVRGVYEEAAERDVLAAAEGRRREQEVRADRVARVEACVGRVAAGIKRTNVRLPEHAVLAAQHEEVLAHRVFLASRSHVHRAYVVSAELAREFASGPDLLRHPLVQADAAREERQQRVVVGSRALEVKESGAVEEKVALLGKKLRKALEVREPLIDLRLREVGVDCQVGADARRWVVEDIGADVHVVDRARAAAARRRVRSAQQVRLEVEPSRLGDVVEANQQTCVRQPVQPLVAQPAAPEALLVLAPHRALEVDPPRLGIRIEVERAEGDLDLERPAGGAAQRLARPDPVPLPVVEIRAAKGVPHQT
jgi:hypothetical protein